MKLVIFSPVEEERLEKIRQAAGPMTVVNARSEAEAADEISSATAFFGKITPELLFMAPRLQWVQSPTASLEHYVFPALVAHPCTLTNMRGLFSDVIADHVFGYIICFARNLHRYIRNQVQARWEPVGGEGERVSLAAGPGVVSAIDRAHLHLADTTLGIIGLGQIGSEIARRALAFGMKVAAVDPVKTQTPDPAVTLWGLERLPELLDLSDFVAIAAPHTPHSARMFRRPQLQMMKKTAYLINVGRGAILDLTDLVLSLEAREIAGAALDVFEVEPLPADHPLWKMENVIITPHVAGYSPRIAERHLQALLDNIRRFVAGEPLQNVVNKAAWF